MFERNITFVPFAADAVFAPRMKYIAASDSAFTNSIFAAASFNAVSSSKLISPLPNSTSLSAGFELEIVLISPSESPVILP